MVCESQVNTNQSSLFCDVPHYIRSVNDVLGLFTKLDSSKFCMGNKETRFMDLAATNRGVFKDNRGKVFMFSVMNFSYLCCLQGEMW